MYFQKGETYSKGPKPFWEWFRRQNIPPTPCWESSIAWSLHCLNCHGCPKCIFKKAKRIAKVQSFDTFCCVMSLLTHLDCFRGGVCLTWQCLHINSLILVLFQCESVRKIIMKGEWRIKKEAVVYYYLKVCLFLRGWGKQENPHPILPLFQYCSVRTDVIPLFEALHLRYEFAPEAWEIRSHPRGRRVTSGKLGFSCFGLFLDPQSYVFFRNVGLSPDYIPLHPEDHVFSEET
jgi:hypothetical protein